jgi:hypothetical protein
VTGPIAGDSAPSRTGSPADPQPPKIASRALAKQIEQWLREHW